MSTTILQFIHIEICIIFQRRSLLQESMNYDIRQTVTNCIEFVLQIVYRLKYTFDRLTSTVIYFKHFYQQHFLQFHISGILTQTFCEKLQSGSAFFFNKFFSKKQTFPEKMYHKNRNHLLERVQRSVGLGVPSAGHWNY